MKTVFVSGSCRLMTTITYGPSIVYPIHSMEKNYVGNNFLGKLHNIKQHIQFIKWINNEVTIPDDILKIYLTTYWNRTPIKDILEKKYNIQHHFKQCDIYLIEICSLKTYCKDGFQVQNEFCRIAANDHTRENPKYKNIVDYNTHELSIKELMVELISLRELIPKTKTILFQTHFRPNIIYNDDNKRIQNREIIFDTIDIFCKNNINVFVYDPSIIVKLYGTTMLIDDLHFSKEGYAKNFEYIYNNYIHNQC